MTETDPLSILLVEDDVEDADIFCRYVRQMNTYGGDVTVARGTSEGRQQLREKGFDIVFVDLRLAGSGSGMDLLTDVQEHFPHIPAIMVTGTGDETRAVEAMKAGAYDYLVKDELNSWNLERSIRHTLEKARLEKERTQLLQRLQKLTVTDELTGLANRRRLETKLNEEIHRSKRNQSPFSVLMIDLDRFKSVNDEYGHQRGDEVLKLCARTLQEQTRRTDLAARYGGEEFCVLLPDTELQGAACAAGKIRRAVEELPDPVPTVSIGIASWEPDVSAEDLIDRADEALYAAKENGRNRTASWPIPV